MDSHRFDNLSRSLSSGSSRRSLLRGMLGGAAALVGLRAGGAAAAPQEKVAVCHYDADSGTYKTININGNALQAHLNHGDNSDIGCDAGATLNTDTCECEQECTVTSCDQGKVFDPTSCSCVDRQPVLGDWCGVRSIWMRSAETESFVCIDIYASSCKNLGCTSNANCTSRLDACVDDDTGIFGRGSYCGGETHCRFVSPGRN